MCRSLAVLPVLLAILISGCRITVVSTPRPDASQVAAADSVPADTLAADSVPATGTTPRRPYRPEGVTPPAELPRIVIQSPAQWAGTGGDTAASPVRQTFTVTGHVHHHETVDGVRVNGQAAIVARARDGGTTFVASLEPTRAGLMEVRVEARAAAGTGVATYLLNVTPPTTPPPAVDTTTVVPGTAADSAWAQRSRWAVVIGVSDYADDAIPARQFAARDARAFREFLRSPAAGPGGIPAARTLVLTDAQATRSMMQNALTSFLSGVGSDDVVLVFLAATAMPDPERPNGAYLLPHDAQPGSLTGTALTVQWLVDALGGVAAHQTIVFADILQAPGQPRGRGAGAALPAQNLVHRALQSAGPRNRSLVVLTAVGAGNLPALEGEQWGGGHGAFSHYLLAGLNGAADGDNDGIVTLAEIVEHTRDAVRRGTGNAQVPGLAAASYDRHWPMSTVLDP